MLLEVVKACKDVTALKNRLRNKVEDVRALERSGKLKRLGKGTGPTLSGVLEDNLIRLNKGHLDEAEEWCGKLAQALKKDPPEGF